MHHGAGSDCSRYSLHGLRRKWHLFRRMVLFVTAFHQNSVLILVRLIAFPGAGTLTYDHAKNHPDNVVLDMLHDYAEHPPAGQ